MKKRLILIPIAALFAITACRKSEQNEKADPNIVPKEIALKVKNLGFDTSGIKKKFDGYIVERDIFLTVDQIEHGFAETKSFRTGKTEHYRTNNLVTGLPRVITVTASGLPSNELNALDQAIGRYNTLRFSLTFSRVASGGLITIQGYSAADGNIAFSGYSGNDYVNGYPSAAGNPAPIIHINTFYTSGYSTQYIAFILSHEMGHAIGFRHTDWQNRSYSCGSGGSESTNGGAIHIPGSPVGEDQESWMLACGNGNRNFSPNDIFALAYLYNPAGGGLPGSVPTWEYYNASSGDNVVTLNGNYHNIYSGWTYITSSFRAFMTSATGRMAIYEYVNPSQGDHTFSSTPNDPNIVGFPGWSMTGLAFYVYSSNVAGSIPVYRYYKASQTRTLFSSNPNIHLSESGWTSPVLAFYAPN